MCGFSSSRELQNMECDEMNADIVRRWRKMLWLVIVCSCGAFLAAADMPLTSEGEAFAIHWYRDSVEMRMVYEEIYQSAAGHVETAVKDGKLQPHTWGVILDVDETVLDNSPYQRNNVIANKSFPEGWNAWVLSGQCVALPGVKVFLKKVHDLGGYISLVTNRTQGETSVTEENLAKDGLV